MKHTPRSVRSPRLDQSGVALPLALLGLVAISFMVTAALLTSSTEVAISGAGQDATQRLYQADAALEQFVLARLQGQNPPTNVAFDPNQSYTVTAPGTTRSFSVQVSRLRQQTFAPGAPGNTSTGSTTTQMRDLFALVLQPANNGSGRSVGAFLETLREYIAFSTNFNSALAVGGDLHVNGNAFTVSGRDTTCNNGRGVQAVERSTDSDITVNNNNMYNNFIGVDSLGNQTQGQAAITNTGQTRQEMMRDILGLTGNQTLDSLVAMVPTNKRWGPRYRSGALAPDPFNILADTTQKVAVVDGNGGVVNLSGGSGLLIIMNGNLRMQGNATFNGIIIVEGNFRLAGNPTVTGAILSLGTNGDQIELDASALANGSITVQFNKCKINAAQSALATAGSTVARMTAGNRTRSWFEVMR